MFKIFQSKRKPIKDNNNSFNQLLDNLSRTFNNISTVDYKEDIQDFILILKQIQDINNTKGQGKGNILKNYTKKKIAIENATRLAIEKYTKKVEELDNANI